MTTTHSHRQADDHNGVAARLHDAGERIVELKDDAAKSLGKRIDALGQLMQQHPFASIAIGLGALYLMARIVRR